METVYRRDILGWYPTTAPAAPKPPAGKRWYECPVCHVVRAVRPVDARKSICAELTYDRIWCCASCHSIRIAPLGARETIKRHGVEMLVWQVQYNLCHNPSKPEKVFMETLSGIGLTAILGCDFKHNSQPCPASNQYVREYWFRCQHSNKNYLVDFWFESNGRVVAVEIDGVYVHTRHTERDAAKAIALELAGVTVIRLTDAEVLHGTAQRKFIEMWKTIGA